MQEGISLIYSFEEFPGKWRWEGKTQKDLRGRWRDHEWLATQLEWLRHLTENLLALLPFLALLPPLAWVPVFLGSFSLYYSAPAQERGRMKVRQMEGEAHGRDWATVERLKGGRMLKSNGEKVEKHSCFYIPLLFFFLFKEFKWLFFFPSRAAGSKIAYPACLFVPRVRTNNILLVPMLCAKHAQCDFTLIWGSYTKDSKSCCGGSCFTTATMETLSWYGITTVFHFIIILCFRMRRYHFFFLQKKFLYSPN